MKKDKNIYYIECYIPNDENKIHSDIKKLIKIGNKYFWPSLIYDYGIGFGAQNYEGQDSIEDALIKLEGYRIGDTNRIIKGSLEDALELKNKYIEILTPELK